VTVTKADFGKLKDGKTAEVYTLKDADLEVKLTNYGARIVAIMAKGRDGKVADVVLGYPSVEGYVNEGSAKTYFGAIVGRYGNRIAGGTFKIDGHEYHIPKNDGNNALHGGAHGFDEQVWTAKQIADGVEFTLLSKDGDAGFPGNLTAHVRYTLVGSALHINYSATTDKPTVVNLTNHSYFNLGGQDSGTILNDVLMINADKHAAAQRYVDAVKSKEPVDDVYRMLSDRDIEFTTTPRQIGNYAQFMFEDGLIKHRPASWKDLFFDNIHALPGS